MINLRTTAAMILIAGTVTIAGCSADRSTTDGSPRAPRSIMVDGTYSDKRFIDMMVPHHAMAIEMAESALEESRNKDILWLAERTVRGQANEIEELKRMRRELYGSRATPKKMHAVVMENMGMGTHGGSTPQLQEDHHHGAPASSSDEFDRRFLDDMLAHHAAAIPEASLALIHSKNARIQFIAREIVDTQSREIGLMGKWRLDRWEHVA